MKAWDRPVRVFESFQRADGTVVYQWMWMYWVKGERRFAMSLDDALKFSVAL